MRHSCPRWNQNSSDASAPYTSRFKLNLPIRIGCLLLVGFLTSVSHSYTIDWSSEQSEAAGGSASVSQSSVSVFAPHDGAAFGSLTVLFTGGDAPGWIHWSVNAQGARWVSVSTGDNTLFDSDCMSGCASVSQRGTVHNRTVIEAIGLVGGSGADYSSATIEFAYGGAPPWVPRPTDNSTELSDWIRREAAKHQRENPSPPRTSDPGGTRGLIDGEYSVPVVAEHGYSDYIWANAATPTAYPNSTSWNAAYQFATDDPFTHFIVPDALPGGDGEFKVIIDDSGPITLQAGTAIDFTTYYPGGVSTFLLTGFNANEGLIPGNTFPFLHGFRFSEEGGASVGYGTMQSGDYTLGGIVNDGDYDRWASSFGFTGDNQADGHHDGVVDAADYVIWRKAASSPATGVGTSQSVPEPSSILLMAMLPAMFVARRR